MAQVADPEIAQSTEQTTELSGLMTVVCSGAILGVDLSNDRGQDEATDGAQPALLFELSHPLVFAYSVSVLDLTPALSLGVVLTILFVPSACLDVAALAAVGVQSVLATGVLAECAEGLVLLAGDASFRN